jgi:tetratricopeptide (TPR) repeat protein
LSANLYQEARTLHLGAECTTQLGDYQDSIVQLCRAEEILAICGMSGGGLDGCIKMSRAEVHLLKSEYTEARSIYTEFSTTYTDKLNTQGFFCGLVFISIAQSSVMIGAAKEDVEADLNQAKKIFGAGNYRAGAIFCKMILADLTLREADVSPAMQLFQECLNLAWGKENQVVTFCLERLADPGRWHALGCAPTWPAVFLSHAQKSREKLALHKALLCLGDLFIAQGDDDTAHSLFTVALHGFTRMDVHCSKGQCLLRLGDLARKNRNFSYATELWRTARPLFERSSQAKDVAQIDARLVGGHSTLFSA